MKHILVGLLVGVALGSSASTPVVKGVDTEPLGPVGSVVLPEITTTHSEIVTTGKTICLELSRELSNEWPVLDVVADWNKNGINTFTTEQVVNCDGVVIVSQSDTKQWWGNTEFYARDIIKVEFSTAAPRDRYHAVVCHELGHVLGLPHSAGDDSCMDYNQNNPEPTQQDLETVGKEPWNAAIARRTMQGIK
jgi:hypothetical protein